MNAYKSWVRANYSWLSSVENAASALTWLLPERLAHSELAPETLSTLLGMFSVVNEHIVSSTPTSHTCPSNLGRTWGGFPPGEGGYGGDEMEGMGETSVGKRQGEGNSPAAWTSNMPWPLMLSLSKEMENLIELVAEQLAGKDGKWSIVAMVEAIKVVTRVTILRSSRGRMLISGGTETNEPEEDERGGGGGHWRTSPLSRSERNGVGREGVVGEGGGSRGAARGRILGVEDQVIRHEDWCSRARGGGRRGDGRGGYWEGEGVRRATASVEEAVGTGGHGGVVGWRQPTAQQQMDDDQRVLAFKAFNRFRAKALQGFNTVSWASSKAGKERGELEREEHSEGASSVADESKSKKKKKKVIGGGGGKLPSSYPPPNNHRCMGNGSEMKENGGIGGRVAAVDRGGGGGPMWRAHPKHGFSAHPPPIPAHDVTPANGYVNGMNGSVWIADELDNGVSSPAAADGRGGGSIHHSSATPVPLSHNPAQLSPCSPLTWPHARPVDSPSSTVDRSSSSPCLPRSASGSASGEEEDDDYETTVSPSFLVYSRKKKEQVMELFRMGLSRMRDYAESTAASLSFADLPPEMRMGRQVILAAEILFILRPLIYVLAIRRYGSKAWRPWCLSLSVDMFALILQSYGEAVCEGKATNWGAVVRRGGGGGEAVSTRGEVECDETVGSARGGKAGLSRREREEAIRRRVHLLFYLIRSPFFDVVTHRPIAATERVLKPVPLIGTLTSKAVEILMGIQAYYFYTAAS